MRRVGRVHTVKQAFDVALDHRERCAEFVRHVRQQCAPLFFVGLQTGRHGVEGAGQGAEFARAALRRTHGKIAGFHAPGRFHQIANRLGQTPERASGKQNAEYAYEQGDETGEPPGEELALRPERWVGWRSGDEKKQQATAADGKYKKNRQEAQHAPKEKAAPPSPADHFRR